MTVQRNYPAYLPPDVEQARIVLAWYLSRRGDYSVTIAHDGAIVFHARPDAQSASERARSMQIATLKQALRRYGRHLQTCSWWENRGKCSCGLLIALGEDA